MWCVNVKAVEGNRKLRLRVVEVGMDGGGGVGHHSAVCLWRQKMGEKDEGGKREGKDMDGIPPSSLPFFPPTISQD